MKKRLIRLIRLSKLGSLELRLKRGQFLFPVAAPALTAMMMYYLVPVYRIWGSRSGGGETPMSVQVFLNRSTESEK